MKKYLMSTIALCILLSACQQQISTPSVFSDEQLIPYSTVTATSTATATLQNAPVNTLAPTTTSTPQVYTVKSDDTLFEIAAEHGITVAELKTANPDVNAYYLAGGMTLLIPASSGASQPTMSAPTSTPFPLETTAPECSASLTGGLYCFAWVENKEQVNIENVSLVFVLTNPQNGETLTQKGLVPLNQITSGTRIPVFTYIASVPFSSPEVALQLQSALSSTTNELVVTIENTDIQISENAQSAVANGQALIQNSDSTAAKIWITAVATDTNGKFVGIRRFGSSDVVNPGSAFPFSIHVYSIGGAIARIDLFGEAIP